MVLHTASPKTILTLKIFLSVLEEAEMKITCLPIFKSITEIIKDLRVYMVLGYAVSKLKTLFCCMDFELCL